MAKLEWCVTVGGSNSAKYATVVSRHRSYEAADKAAIVKRGQMFAAGDLTTRCGVELLETFLAEGGSLP